MKRKAFILTEILTGMILQVGFAVVLCSAFYMILNFSSTAQQGFAANDKGQMVIAYFDSRIRNSGLGLWGCPSSRDIRSALNQIPALKEDTAANRKLCLPVAVLNNTNADGNVTGSDTLSRDRTGRFYRGNVLTLLYAHKDTNEVGNNPVRLILCTDNKQNPVTLKPASTPGGNNIASNDFSLIDAASQKPQNKSYIYSQFAKSNAMTNIKSYAVMESAGVPVYTRIAGTDKVELRAFTVTQPTIYPMSEMLNLECQRLYTAKDAANGYNFKFMELKEDGTWGNSYYHTKDILELYMTLDTRPNTADRIPIFELRVLVSEGLNENGTTDKPKDWPGRWTDDFKTHKVHVSKASWKLYNLAPFFTN